jgi:hypothetical protein
MRRSRSGSTAFHDGVGSADETPADNPLDRNG